MPEWVAAVPSHRSGDLVPSFACRLAEELGLAFHDIVEAAGTHPQQKSMQNSAHQRSNVEGAYRLGGPPPEGPGLLVDDLVDSGWTLTEVGRLLRRDGSGPIYPVALGSTSARAT
jgi:ATP-dependent DNA helicase RecQ